MSYSNRPWTEKRIQKCISEGRGQGEGQDYLPWLMVQDVSSLGRQTRIDGWKTNRVHHLHSDNETRYFLLSEWSDIVVDIREQFPILDRDETLAIADRLNIRHPVDATTKTPIVLTTDFLITALVDGKPTLWARTVKPASELRKRRTMEKLKIEQEYWQSKEVSWRIIVDTHLSRIMAKNIAWVHSAYKLNPLDGLSVEELIDIGELLKSRLQSKNDSIKNMLLDIDYQTGTYRGTALYLLRHLIATKQVLVDLNEKFDIRKSSGLVTVVALENVRLEGR